MLPPYNGTLTHFVLSAVCFAIMFLVIKDYRKATIVSFIAAFGVVEITQADVYGLWTHFAIFWFDLLHDMVMDVLGIAAGWFIIKSVMSKLGNYISSKLGK